MTLSIRRIAKLLVSRQARSFVAVLTLVCSCGQIPAEEPAGKDYPVRLSAPSRLKERYKYVGSSTQEITTVYTDAANANARPVVDATTVQFEATLEVLAIDSKGTPTKFAFTVAKLMRTDGKTPGPILPGGAVAIADGSALDPAKPEATGLTLVNGKLTPEQANAVTMVFGAPRPETPTDDEAFGTEATQKIGASWPINPEKASKHPVLEGWSPSSRHTKGNTTLDGVKSIQGSDWIVTRLEASSDKFEGSASPGQTIDRANLKLKLVALTPLPLAGLTGAMVQDSMTEFFMTNRAADGSIYSTRTTTKYHVELEWTALPAGQ